MAKKEYVADERARTFVPMEAVKVLHEQFKADLVFVQKALETKLSDVHNDQRKLLASADSLNKSAENLHSTTKDLESKVVKVNDSTVKLASTTMSYRDAMLAKPASPNRSNADPKVLINADRRSRQVLIGYNASEDNATLNTSLLALKDKANKVIVEMDNPSRPEALFVECITRTRDGSLLLLFNSREAADWLRDPDVTDRFIDKFAIGAYLRDRNYNVLLRWVPIILDPNNSAHHREIEEANSLPENTIQKMRWIKPVIRRRAGQTKAHATITLTTADTANRTIRDGIDICGARVFAERAKQEPLQCLKCRGWEHKAEACTAQSDTCGTCGESHRTNACSNKNKLYCASCRDNTHASWDRTCPEFRRCCAAYDAKFPENKMVYFPTDQDWTLTSKPERVPLEDRFPARFAVNSLPVATNRRHPKPKPTVRLPPNNQPGARPSSNKSQERRNASQQQHSGEGEAERILLTRTQPNLVPLGRGREEGELSDRADHDSFLDHQDTAFVEASLNGVDWRAEPPGSWDMDGWRD
jgi:hypothetical protein